MNAQEVIARLCRLQSEVYDTIDPLAQSPADCFCGEGGFWKDSSYDGTEENGYRNSGECLEFIESTVCEALVKYSSRAETSDA